MNDPIMLKELRNSMEDLIESDPSLIAIRTDQEWERTASGGIRKSAPDPDAEPPEPVARWFAEVTGDPRIVRSPDGEQLVSSHVLIGPSEDTLAEGQEFEYQGRSFRIVEVDRDRSFDTKAWVVEKA